MRARIVRYDKYISGLREADSTETSGQQVREALLIQIGFFQPERLIHLLVTICFALLAMMGLFLLLIHNSLASILLLLLFMVLLLPYINHYYILENRTQKLYEYYDAISKKIQQ